MEDFEGLFKEIEEERLIKWEENFLEKRCLLFSSEKLFKERLIMWEEEPLIKWKPLIKLEPLIKWKPLIKLEPLIMWEEEPLIEWKPLIKWEEEPLKMTWEEMVESLKKWQETVEPLKKWEGMVETLERWKKWEEKGERLKEERLKRREMEARCRLVKNICIRAANIDTETIDFFRIPVYDDLNRSGEPEFLRPYLKSSTVSGVSGFAAVGSGLFCVGGLGGETKNYDEIPNETYMIYGFDTEGRETHVGKMVSPRTCPYSLGLGGNLYIVGALARLNDSWAEIFTPSNSSRPLPLPTSSSSSSLTKGPLATAALHSWKKILVASCSSNSAYLLDVMTEKWEEFDHKFDFSAVRGEAAVVRNTTLCWFDDTFHVLKAYDLVLKMSFREPIKGLDKVGVLFPGVSETDCKLLALDDNHLCLVWIDHRGYADTFDSLLHCTKVRVSLDKDNNHGTARFDASVDSSQSFVLEAKSSFLDALVL